MPTGKSNAARLSASMIWMLLALTANSLVAQTRMEEGEEVRVFFLGEWRDGTVIEVDKKEVLVEFEFVNTRQQSFNRKDVRKLCEVDAVDFCRQWKSAEGDFKIDAALKTVEDGNAVLIKPDLDEIKVPMEKLSKTDVNYVKRMIKDFENAVARGDAPAMTPALPALEQFESSFGSIGNYSSSTNSPKPFGATPEFLLQFNQSGMGFNMARNRQELIAVIPVGGPEQLVLMTAREDNFFNDGEKYQSQVYWVSLKTRKIVATIALTTEHFPLDYDPRTKLLLTYFRNTKLSKLRTDDTKEPNHFTIWRVEPASSKADPVVRWQADADDWPNPFFCKIVNDHIIVTKTDRHSFVGWDFVDKKQVYSLKTQSFFDAPVVITPDRRFLIMPEDGQITVVQSDTGDTEMRFRVSARHVSGANINPAGNKLVAISEQSVFVWDLESGNPNPTVHPAPLIGSPFKARIEWIDDDHILTETHNRRILYRLSLSLPIWSYEMDVRDYWLNRDPLKNMVVDGKFFYVVQPDPFSSATAVGAVQLPGPDVERITGNITRDQLLIMKQGTRVGLDVSGAGSRTKIQGWLEQKIEENGWVLDPDAEIVIYASMGVGEKQSVTYYEIANPKNTRSISFRPHFASLEIKKGELLIWQTGTSTGAPPVLYSNNITGRNLGGNYNNPQVSFFQNVEIDDEIIDPKYSHGFGVSRLGLRGIEVVSTSPPGREDDPQAAAEQATRDQEEAFEQRRRQGGNQ